MKTSGSPPPMMMASTGQGNILFSPDDLVSVVLLLVAIWMLAFIFNEHMRIEIKRRRRLDAPN
jgi:hypothetical protein